MPDNTISIYIHIPFCIKKCPYCDFNSYSLKVVPEQDYINALLTELKSVKRELPFASKPIETIYIGGGTPSVIAPCYIASLLAHIKKNFPLKDNAEITIEVNPGTTTKDKLKRYMDFQIGRISIGVQSFNNNVLNKLGRIHNAKDSLNAYEFARDVGFKNLNLDLIFAVEGQDIDMWLADIETAVRLRPEHISIYGLSAPEGTKFHKLCKNGKLNLPNEETYLKMYNSASVMLKESGYYRYEISNFSLPAHESRHNLGYWNGSQYIGIGAGAHSYFIEQANHIGVKNWGARLWNEEDIFLYMDKVKRLGNGVSGMEVLTKEQAMLEYLFLGLRQTKGINKKDFYNKFGLFPEDRYHKVIDKLRQEKLLILGKDALRLTEKGIALSDTVFASFT